MSHYYRASQISPCKRKLSAIRMDIPAPEPPQWLLMAAEEGNLHEQVIKQKLVNEGWAVFREQEEVIVDDPDDRFQIIGHIDGVAKLNGYDQVLLEIKSMSQFEYDRWTREGWDGFPSYANQITAYWHALGLDGCLYIVKNRSTGFLNRTVLQKPPRDIDDVMAHVREVEEWCQKHEFPMIAEYDEQSIECRRCFYTDVLGCVTKPVFNEREERELAAAEEMFFAGKSHEQQGKAMIAEARAVFEEHSVACGMKGQAWEFGKLRILHHHVERKGYEVSPTEYDETRITVRKDA